MELLAERGSLSYKEAADATNAPQDKIRSLFAEMAASREAFFGGIPRSRLGLIRFFPTEVGAAEYTEQAKIAYQQNREEHKAAKNQRDRSRYVRAEPKIPKDNRTKAQRKEDADKAEKVSRHPGVWLKPRAVTAAKQVIWPAHVKRTKCPPCDVERFTPKGRVFGEFSARGIGRYID